MADTANIEVLKRQIARAEVDLVYARETGAASDDFAVLFTGNWHDAVPRNIVLNQTLNPVEKVCWQAIRLTINNPQKPGSAPSRDELAIAINCSAPTVTTARQMLRLTRYMTFCSQVRSQGKYMGEIYLLHDEPLGINETLELDPTYIDFCEEITKAGKKSSRHRQAAQNALDSIQNQQSFAPQTQPEQFAQRIEAGLNNYGIESAVAMLTPNEEDETRGDQRKKFTPEQKATNNHQRKNFAPVEETTKQVEIQAKIPENTENHQRKNFSLDQNLIDSDRSKKFFSHAFFCSSYCSSSKQIINTNARARDNEQNKVFQNWAESEDKLAGITSTRSSVKARKTSPEWQLSLDEINTIGFEDANLEQDGKETHQTADKPKKQLVGADYTSVRIADGDDIRDLNKLITRYLPEIDIENIKNEVHCAFVEIQPQISVISRFLKGVAPQAKRDILLQYTARKVSFINGWSRDDVGNAIGFIRTLIKRVENHEFTPDSMCCELIRAIETNDKAYLYPTNEKRDLRAQFVN